MRRTHPPTPVAEARKTVHEMELRLKRAKGEWENAGSPEQGPEQEALFQAQEHYDLARENWKLEERRARGFDPQT